MPDPHTIILFDGICNFCNATVNFLIDHDHHSRLRFASLQSATGRDLLLQHSLPHDYLNSVVVIDDGKLLTESTAFFRIVSRLGGAWHVLSIFRIVPRPLRDFVYRFIARHRYRWFGRRDSCRVPSPELRERFLT